MKLLEACEDLGEPMRGLDVSQATRRGTHANPRLVGPLRGGLAPGGEWYWMMLDSGHALRAPPLRIKTKARSFLFMKTVGILALQGDFEAHSKAIEKAGGRAVEVRSREEMGAVRRVDFAGWRELHDA